MSHERVGVVGAGAIGLDLAVALIEAGARVSILARGPSAAALRGRGLEHRGRGRASQLIPASAYRCVEQPAALGEQDFVFVATKSGAFTEVAATLAPLLGPGTTLVPALNGVPPWFGLGRPALAARIGPELQAELGGLAPAQLLGAVIHRNAARIGPGVVERVAGPGLLIGELDGRRSARVERLASLLPGPSYALRPSPDIYAAAWHKLLINATINPLSVVCGQTLDLMVSAPALRERVRGLIAELEALGVALELIGPGSFDVEALFTRFASERRGAITSMLRDFQRGQPLELERIVHLPLALAAAPGVAVEMPRLRALLAELEAHKLA